MAVTNGTVHSELRQESRVSDSITSLDVSGLFGPLEAYERCAVELIGFSRSIGKAVGDETADYRPAILTLAIAQDVI